MCKGFLLLAPFLILLGILPGLSLGQPLLEEGEPPENYQFQVYLDEEEALAKVFEGCDEVKSEFIVLTQEGYEYFKGLLKRPDLETAFQVYIGKKGGVVDRYAIITEEMGCFHPITWILSADTEGRIRDIAVMIYRETRGHEVRRKRFLKQFEGESIRKNRFRINRDIINITGATVSVQAVCRGVRKMLTFIEELYLKETTSSTTLVRRLTPEEAGALMGPSQQLFTTARFIRGVKVVVAAETDSEKRFFSTADKVFEELERIERLFRKELKFLNKHAGKGPFSSTGEVLEAVKRCYQYGVLTDGAFDITVRPLLEKWGIYKGKLKELTQDRIASVLPAVSYKNILIDGPGKTVSFNHRDTEIDLGPVVKGYAVDRAVELFKKAGIRRVCINYGCVTRILEPPSEKDSWKIGIQHPVKTDTVIGSLPISNRGVAFVADYSRYLTLGDKVYTHLVDPRVGRPNTGGVLGVMAVADTAERAGVLASAIFVLGKEGAQRLSTAFPDMEWVLLYGSFLDVDFVVSSNMADRFVKQEEKIFKFGKGSGCPFSP